MSVSLGLALFKHYLSSAKGLRKGRTLNGRKSVPKREEKGPKKALGFWKLELLLLGDPEASFADFFFFHLFNALKDFIEKTMKA